MIRRLSFLAATALLAVPLHAIPMSGLLTPGLTFGNAVNNQSQTMGWAFEVTGNVTITALGLFDAQQNGLADSHALGLWTSTGTLLRSTIIAEGTVAPLVNQYRYVDVAPLALTIGQTYIIGAHYAGIQGMGSLDSDPQDRDYFQLGTMFYNHSFGDGINFLHGTTSGQQMTGMHFPGTENGGLPHAGANFLYTLAPTPPPAVPEGGVGVWAGLALMGLVVAGRRHGRVA